METYSPKAPAKSIEADLDAALSSLLDYCRTEGWKGYDPYDGLNSPLARPLRPLGGRWGKLARTIWIQLLKRSPFNARPLLGVRKEFNSKGIALAARGLMLMPERALGPSGSDSGPTRGGEVDRLMRLLYTLRSDRWTEACWGYNFDWQSRAFYAPRGTPNVVCTVFAGLAHLDFYDRSGQAEALEIAVSSCRWLLDRINRTADRGGQSKGFCFSYTPLDHSRVHNVNLLAAEMLARTYRIAGSEEFADAAYGAATYSLTRQRQDGSWVYGEARDQQWIDSFHTGFMLTSVRTLVATLSARQWMPNLTAGYTFYKDNFFLADCSPKYYNDRLYPIDVHSAAVGIITLAELGDIWPEALDRAGYVMQWAIRNLQDPRGFFHFQMHKFHRIKIPYMRWAQAWMLYAMGVYMAKTRIIDNG
jgi:hypothetical protein